MVEAPEKTTTITRTPFCKAPGDAQRPRALVINEGVPILAKRPPKTTTAIKGFADPDAIEAAFERLGWDIEKEIELYAEIAEDPSIMPNIRIRAAQALHDLAIKALLLRGDIAEISASRTIPNSDGSVVVERISSVVRNAQTAYTQAKELVTHAGLSREPVEDDEEDAAADTETISIESPRDPATTDDGTAADHEDRPGCSRCPEGDDSRNEGEDPPDTD